MKPDHYERDHALAAEYVLGTLTGGARRRFEVWMMESERLRRRVWYWERRLASLNQAVASQTPPATVWQGVERRLWSPAPAGQPSPRRWQWIGGLCAAAVLVLALLPSAPFFSTSQSGPLYMGVVQNGKGQPLWVVESRPGNAVLRVRAVQAGDPVPGKDYELWLLPHSGKPESLGVLPDHGGDRHIVLSRQQETALRSSGNLAVSLEPAGGSPTGQPTGPVLYQVRMLEIEPRLRG